VTVQPIASPSPSPTPAPTPEGTPAPSGMPEGLPPQFWDSAGGKVNLPDLVKSYGEISAFKTQHDQRVAGLPKTATDYKIEVKLPDTVKLPDGMTFKIDDKDPRIPAVQALAHKHQLSQETVTELIALHAQSEIEAHVAAEASIQAEMKKLGENGKARVEALNAYFKANLSKEEDEALRPVIGNAAAFAAVEKLIAKAVTQRVPGNVLPEPAKPVALPIEQRWYPPTQQKAS